MKGVAPKLPYITPMLKRQSCPHSVWWVLQMDDPHGNRCRYSLTQPPGCLNRCGFRQWLSSKYSRVRRCSIYKSIMQ